MSRAVSGDRTMLEGDEAWTSRPVARSARLGAPMQALVLSFPPFRLDVADERLFQGGTEIKLRRKPFAILKYLAVHPRRLVKQQDLVEAVRGKGAVDETLPRTPVRP